MKQPCELIRDLIPLCLDQTASDVSRDAVQTHLQVCPDCAAVYADMSAALPQAIQASPRPETVSRTIRLLHQKKRSRVLRSLFVIVLSAAILGAGVFFGLRLLAQTSAPIPIDEVTVTLSRFSRTEAHPLVMTADTDAPHNALAPVLTHAQERSFDIVYLQLLLPVQEEPSILAVTRHTMDLDDLVMDAEGHMLLESTDEDGAPIRTEISEVRLGTPQQFRVLYRTGTLLPEVSSSYRVYDRAHRELPDALAHLLPDALCGDLADYSSLSDHDAYWEQYCYLLTERATHMRQIAPEFIAP